MTPDPEDLAKTRFQIMSLARFASIALVFAGIANIAGKLWPATAPWLGYALFFAGVGSFYTLPVWLKRRWSSPSE
jgi:hypothetical protein